MLKLHTPKVLGPVTASISVSSVQVQATASPKGTSFLVHVTWLPHDASGKVLSPPQTLLAQGDDAATLLAAMTTDPLPAAEALLLACLESGSSTLGIPPFAAPSAHPFLGRRAGRSLSRTPAAPLKSEPAKSAAPTPPLKSEPAENTTPAPSTPTTT